MKFHQELAKPTLIMREANTLVCAYTCWLFQFYHQWLTQHYINCSQLFY